jgi:hypothetical protein
MQVFVWWLTLQFSFNIQQALGIVRIFREVFTHILWLDSLLEVLFAIK